MAAIHFRILGYIITIFLHVGNLTVLELMKEDLSGDIKIKVFRGMLYRYFTCWTIMLQILYAILGLYTDILTLKNVKKKDYSIWKPIKGIRNVMFAALVWPCTMLVFTVFWSLYLYDRSLIFPKFIDQVISSTSNHILHTAIVPIAVWEVLFRPRTQPRSHMRNLVHLIVHCVVYLSVLYYTYVQEGIWLYPIFKVTYGTIHFFLLHVYLGIIFIMFYYLQWLLNYVIHGPQVEKKKIK